MKDQIVLKIDTLLKNTLAEVRAITGIDVADYNGFIWVKCITEDDEVVKKLHQIRFIDWYVLRNDYLFKRDELTPELRFFKATWIPVNEYFPVSLPTTALSGQLQPPTLKLELKRHTIIEDSIGVLTHKNTVTTYLEDAPNFRFKNLKYAESSDEKIFLFGTPLLPIKGISYWQYKNILLPNGFILKTKTHLDLLIEKTNKETFILVTVNNRYQIIPKENIKLLTRKAIIF